MANLTLADLRNIVDGVDGIIAANPSLSVSVDNIGIAADQKLTVWLKVAKADPTPEAPVAPAEVPAEEPA